MTDAESPKAAAEQLRRASTHAVHVWAQEATRGYLVKAAARCLLASAHVHHNRLHGLQVALHICVPTVPTCLVHITTRLN